MKRSTKQAVLEELLLQAGTGEAVSGRALAQKLGVSRNSVWKAITSLEREGFVIEADRSGYTLIDEGDALTAEAITAKLAFGARVFLYKQTDSTNAAAKRLLLEGVAPPFLVIAESQSAGKGRFGREFYSPAKTGVYMTLVPDAEPQLNRHSGISPVTLIAAAAVAVVRTIRALTGRQAEIKWVNDVFVGGKKVCGILTEATADIESGTIKNILIGVGINLSTQNFPADLEHIAGSLWNGVKQSATVSRAEMIAGVANEIINLTAPTKSQQCPFLDEYRKYSFILGKNIEFFQGETKFNALAHAIDDQCGLVVRFDNGETQTLRSGEVSVKIDG